MDNVQRFPGKWLWGNGLLVVGELKACLNRCIWWGMVSQFCPGILNVLRKRFEFPTVLTGVAITKLMTPWILRQGKRCGAIFAAQYTEVPKVVIFKNSKSGHHGVGLLFIFEYCLVCLAVILVRVKGFSGHAFVYWHWSSLVLLHGFDITKLM